MSAVLIIPVRNLWFRLKSCPPESHADAACTGWSRPAFFRCHVESGKIEKVSVMHHSLRVSAFLLIISVLFAGVALCDAESRKAEIAQANALKPFNSLIGSWRGVGQIRRGSSRGAWTEKVTCEWSFNDEQAAVLLKSDGGKQFEQLAMTWDADSEELVLVQTVGQERRTYRGRMPEEWPARIQLQTEVDREGNLYRCTIQQLSDIRSTLLFEKRTSPTGSFRRLAGIGYTRAGSSLAVVGGNKPICVVTGGLGTIAVKHKGKTYYVCCQGCVQAFNDAPDEIIAEYQASLKEK